MIPFGFWATGSRVASMTEELRAHIEGAGLVPKGEPVVAQYNPPWTPPPFRQNEILWSVEAP